MSVTTGSGSHLRERDLLRYMDRQMERAALRRARGHLAHCAACAARLEALERRAAEVSAWLGELPSQAPRPEQRDAALAALRRARYRPPVVPPGVRTLLQAAAIVLLLVGASVGTAPGRNFIGDTVERLSGPQPGPVAARVLEWLGRDPGARLALERATASAPAAHAEAEQEDGAFARGPADAPTAGASAPVTFNPRGSYVVVQFDSYQSAGAAVIRIGDVPQATAQVTAGMRSEQILPLADGIRVRNARGSAAQYLITVPGQYRYVRVRIAGGEEMILTATPARQEWIWTVSLRERAAGD
jgi:hypothetical protein